MDSQNVLENVFLADVSFLQSFIRNNLIYLFSVNYSLSERKHKVWVTQRLNSSQCWEGFCILVSLTWKMTCLQRVSLCIFGHPTWPEWPTFLFLRLEELVFLDLCLSKAGALDSGLILRFPAQCIILLQVCNLRQNKKMSFATLLWWFARVTSFLVAPGSSL